MTRYSSGAFCRYNGVSAARSSSQPTRRLEHLAGHDQRPEPRRCPLERLVSRGERRRLDRLALELQLDPGAGEQLSHVRLVAPQQRRLGDGWGRGHEGAHRLEERPHLAVRRPGGDAEPATGAEHTRHLGGRDRMPGREHASEGGEHDVEACVGAGQLLGVALDPVQLDPGVGSRLPTGLEQLRCEVEPGHTGTGLGGPDRCVAGAAGDIEHVVSGRYPGCRDNPGPTSHSCRRAISGKSPAAQVARAPCLSRASSVVAVAFIGLAPLVACAEASIAAAPPA